jgi:4-amino-4-deoxy-L-arabinose transferase-like glycosyltransferase
VSRRTWLVGIFAILAFAQTLAYYVYLRDDPGNYNGAGASGDQVAYIELAQQVLHGTWQGAVHYMPGLPAVIAIGQLALGDPRLGIAVLQGLLYAGLVLYASRLAARAFGAATSTWAAACVGLNPAIGYYAAQALTEFLTGAVLLLLAGAVDGWSRSPSLWRALYAGVLVGAAAYLRAEYLALAVLFAAILLWLRGRQAIGQALGLLAATVLVMAPWVARYTVTSGQPALYNESPFSNLVLMGTWFRVFDEQTFAQLQQIETAPGPRETAIAAAAGVGPRPDLSQRYMEQARGPYELPLGETLSLALGNIQLNLRQYLVNHLAEAPLLIWAGHTPIRQADAPRLPSSARYLIWGAELALLCLALWQAARALGDPDTRALSASFLLVVVFLTLVHVVIAVDERFTTPALPLVGLFAGSRLAALLGSRQRRGFRPTVISRDVEVA